MSLRPIQTRQFYTATSYALHAYVSSLIGLCDLFVGVMVFVDTAASLSLQALLTMHHGLKTSSSILIPATPFYYYRSTAVGLHKTVKTTPPH